MRTRGLPLHVLAWTAALLPFLTTHVSYLMAASAGDVPWCMPYWDSCTSISATGRELPAKLWFKLGMIPSALATAWLWWCAQSWRRLAGPSRSLKSLRWLPLTGTLAAFFLILYTVALGEEGDAYALVRRSGVVMAFAFTYVSQVLLTGLIGELAEARGDACLRRWYRRLVALSVILLGVGVLSVILDLTLGPRYDEVEDAFEWVMALLLNLWFAGLAMAWRHERPVVAVVLPERPDHQL